MTEYSDIQQNLCLCAITAAGTHNEKFDPTYVYEKVQHSLQISPATRDTFTLVWGPAVLRYLPDINNHDDYMLYMVQNKNDPHDFRLVIRYTLSLLNSLEDFFFIPADDWGRFVDESLDNVCINCGMGWVLNDIKDIASNNPLGEGLTVVEFLRTQLQQMNNERITLTVTGHSFAGMVAPVLALYLQKQLLNDNVQVKIQAGGATTIGNANFAEYIDQHFGEDYLRLVNTHDVTGLMWDPELMKGFSSIYKPDYEPDPCFAELFEGLRSLIETANLGGTQAGTALEFTQPLITDSSFTGQAMYQHSTGYFDHFNIKQRNESDPDNGEDVVLPDEAQIGFPFSVHDVLLASARQFFQFRR